VEVFFIPTNVIFLYPLMLANLARWARARTFLVQGCDPSQIENILKFLSFSILVIHLLEYVRVRTYIVITCPLYLLLAYFLFLFYF
jgi:hypothetical protein